MRKKWVSSFAALLVGGSASFAQAPVAATSADNPNLFQGPGYSVTECQSPGNGWFSGTAEDCNFRTWGGFDYLLWRFKRQEANVPLVTTSNLADAGVIGAPSTRVLFGNDDLNSPRWHSGYRLTIGAWLDSDRTSGVEVSGFIFNRTTPTDFTSSTIDPTRVLAIPFINVTPGGGIGFVNPGNVSALAGNNAFVIAGGFTPGAFPTVGSIRIHSTNELWGAELNGLFNLSRTNQSEVNFIYGFRYVDLHDNLYLDTVTASTDPTIGVNGRNTFQDHFGTRNQFYGGQIGVKGEWSNGIIFVNALAKIALGVNHENVTIDGSFVDPNPAFFNGNSFGAGQGGLFAQRSNSGTRYRNRFMAVPETQINVGLNLLQNLRIFAGYDFLYLSDVVRPGNQIDPRINLTQVGGTGGGNPGVLVGPAQPAQTFNQTSFWAQGVTFGIQFSY